MGALRGPRRLRRSEEPCNRDNRDYAERQRKPLGRCRHSSHASEQLEPWLCRFRGLRVPSLLERSRATRKRLWGRSRVARKVNRKTTVPTVQADDGLFCIKARRFG